MSYVSFVKMRELCFLFYYIILELALIKCIFCEKIIDA